MGSRFSSRVDPEKQPLAAVDLGETPKVALKKDLTSRHMQMIAIGGAIGMGLFVGSGGALKDAGPASILIAFALIGCMIYTVVMALGELGVMFPIEGSFATYFSRFIDPAWGFAMGWNYAMSWLVTLPLELSAAALVIDYWKPVVNAGVWIGILLIMLSLINALGVKGYGDAEIAFSMVKVVAVIGFLILGIVALLGGTPNTIPFGKTWEDPGPFNNGIEGFCSVFVVAAFSFSGTELVGLAAAEAANPKVTIPAASRNVTFRILLFYLGSLGVIGLIVPSNHEGLGGDGVLHSPFVIAIQIAGIETLASVFNAVILVAILSVGNSSVYGSSRMLHALARSGQAPAWLGYTDRKGRPVMAIIVSLLFGLIAFSGQAGDDVRDQVFNWLLAISGLTMIFTWLSIAWVHLRFRAAWRAAGHSVDELVFAAPSGEWGSWFALAFNALVLVAQLYVAIFPIGGTDNPYMSFFQAYLTVPVVLILFFYWKFSRKTAFMVLGHSRSCFRTEPIDIVSGRVFKDVSNSSSAP